MPNAATLEAVKGAIQVLLPVVASLAALGRARGRRGPGLVALSLVAALSVALYAWWGARKYDPYLNGYDVYHYYMSARYRDELGTDLLYACTMVADSELKTPRFEKVQILRDLGSYEIISRREALTRAETCHDRFSERRWERFKHDLGFFQRLMPLSEWRDVFIDRGANASPVWQVTGGALARWVPVEGLRWAAHADTLLLAAAMTLTAWAFGAEVALVATAFLATCFSTRWPPIGGALFRYDWISLSIASICLWRKERPVAAGAALAWATGSRLFPFLFFAGVAARGLWRLARERRVPRPEARFALGYGAAGLVLCAVALGDVGAQGFRDFREKMAVHAASENISVMRVGLPVAAAWRGELPDTQHEASRLLREKRVLATQQERWLKAGALAAGLAVLLAAGRRQLSDNGALLLGVALIPLALQISYYYYVFLAIPVILHASGLPRAGPTVGLFAVTWINAAALLASAAGVTRYTVLAPGSLLVCAYAIGLVIAAALRR